MNDDRITTQTRPSMPPRVALVYSAEDAGYIATCNLPGISAFGDTLAAALREVCIAYTAALEVYQDEGWEVPV